MESLVKAEIEVEAGSIEGSALKLPLGSGGTSPHGGVWGEAPLDPKTTSIEVKVFPGPIAAPMAMPFWNNLDERTRRVICWDVAPKKRPGYLQMGWFNADYVALVFKDNRVLGAAWVSRIGAVAGCATIHFCMARELRKDAVAIGKRVMQALWKETDLQSFVGLIPTCFGHAMRYAMRLGFTRGARLQASCAIWPARLADGWLLTINRIEI